MTTNEDAAYEALAREIMSFVGSRDWESATGIYQVLGRSTSTKWFLYSQGEKSRKGSLPSADVASHASNAVFFLRSKLFAETGHRIWGLTFTLYPDGKFNIEYDYNKPDGYEETDETVDLSQALEDLQKQDVHISKK